MHLYQSYPKFDVALFIMQWNQLIDILLFKWIFCFSLCRLNLSLSSKFSLCWATGIQRCNSIHQLELQAFGATRFYTLISPSGYLAASGIRTKKRAANTERGKEIFLGGDLNSLNWDVTFEVTAEHWSLILQHFCAKHNWSITHF